MAACEHCPSPGACAACPFLRPTFGRVRVVEGVEKISAEKKLTPTTYYFSNPVRQRGGELPVKTGEIICFICKETASTCRHSNSNTSALAAA